MGCIFYCFCVKVWQHRISVRSNIVRGWDSALIPVVGHSSVWGDLPEKGSSRIVFTL